MIIEFSIYTYNGKLEELGIDQEQVIQPAAINMWEVSSIWRNLHDETGDEGCTVAMKSGESYTVLTPYQTVLRLWHEVIGGELKKAV